MKLASRYAFIVGLTFAIPAVVAAADPVVAFDPQEIRLPAPLQKPGSLSTAAFIYTDDTALLPSAITKVEDAGATDGTTPGVIVAFDKLTLLSRTDKRADWKAVVTVSGMGRLTTSSRRAVVTFRAADNSNQLRTIAYTLTNHAKSFTWSVEAEAKSLALPANDRMTVRVTPSGDRATQLAISMSSLQSEETHAKIGRDSLDLCASATDVCNTPIDIPAGVPTSLYVKLKNVPNGTYAGAIDLRVDESAEVKSFPLTVYKTTNPARGLGALSIFLGICVSLLITHVARNAIARAQSLLPASRLRELAAARIARLTECRVDAFAPGTLSRLNAIVRSLSTSELLEAGYLPPMVANPFGAADSKTAMYEPFLQSTSTELTSIGYVIDQGFCVIRKMINPDDPAHVAAFERACKDLDKLDFTRTVEQLRPDVAKAVSTVEQAITRAPLENVHVFRSTDAPTTEQLLWRVTWISGLVWLVWALITLVLGTLALIATNPGFGTWVDLLKCFAWGAGVQIVGQQLQNLTPSAVSSSLGITVPKS